MLKVSPVLGRTRDDGFSRNVIRVNYMSLCGAIIVEGEKNMAIYRNRYSEVILREV